MSRGVILSGLKPQREKAGLTQRALAARMRVSYGAVAAWESGRNMPSSDKLPVLADVLGCSIEELFEAENEEPDRSGVSTEELLERLSGEPNAINPKT